jgi:hypothetical protein
MNMPVFGNEYESEGTAGAAIGMEPVDGKEFGEFAVVASPIRPQHHTSSFTTSRRSGN